MSLHPSPGTPPRLKYWCVLFAYPCLQRLDLCCSKNRVTACCHRDSPSFLLFMAWRFFFLFWATIIFLLTISTSFLFSIVSLCFSSRVEASCHPRLLHRSHTLLNALLESWFGQWDFGRCFCFFCCFSHSVDNEFNCSLSWLLLILIPLSAFST